MKLHYTKGKWDVTQNNTVYTISNGKDNRVIEIAKIIPNPQKPEDVKGNKNIIINAPEGIKVELESYLHLQIESLRDNSFAIKVDSVKAKLRNHISKVFEINPETLQKEIEKAAYEIKKREKSSSDVIKKFI